LIGMEQVIKEMMKSNNTYLLEFLFFRESIKRRSLS
jgi:hypothetical protein